MTSSGGSPAALRLSSTRRAWARSSGRRALDAGLADVAYGSMDSPVGELLVAVTDRGLVRVAFASEPSDEVLEELAARVSPRVLRLPGPHGRRPP